jgi:hypothetical protein
MTTWALLPRAGRPARARLIGRVLLGAAVVLTALVLLALAGAARDDAAIDARPGRATAEVLAVTSTRTLVQFAGADGQVYRPTEGLAYPSGLQVRQLVRVEYDQANPQVVRVAGRTWMIGLLPAVIVLPVFWTLVLPVAWWLRGRRC